MSNDENKCDKIQPSTISKNKSVAIENVVAPEVKILNRGDLLGAINCLFPELQLKSGHIKLKEKFSLFSYSLHELTAIFESGRIYRSRTDRNIKYSIANQSLRPSQAETNRINLKRYSVTENMVTASKSWKSKAQKKQHNYETGQAKRCHQAPSFQSSYIDFLTKFLESHFPDRFVDFKNIECVIFELSNLFKEMSKDCKIAPFNPNLPVLNISECDKVVRMSSKPNDIFKTSASPKRICSKRKSRSRTQIEFKGRRKKSIVKKSQCTQSTRQSKIKLPEDDDDENVKEMERSIDDLLSDDTFSPRYKAKHTSDMLVIFRKSPKKRNSTDFKTLEKEAIEQYESIDDALDMDFNLLEIKSNLK
ncbi:uncharacterized protein LOC119079381 isoform X1 [Bradysia coprophila]|uniref:uncharacterized protein LOC119079381 isoform X1 n=1 Tax=Bradysia coprophila TaxID=38358 RepID=UPI00187D8F6C|nr:uncharacterized protein LOC119079381 isoform X1 [Bradysia coprophila]